MAIKTEFPHAKVSFRLLDVSSKASIEVPYFLQRRKSLRSRFFSFFICTVTSLLICIVVFFRIVIISQLPKQSKRIDCCCSLTLFASQGVLWGVPERLLTFGYFDEQRGCHDDGRDPRCRWQRAHPHHQCLWPLPLDWFALFSSYP